MGHKNRSKDNTNNNETSSKISTKPSDTQIELYEQNMNQQYQSPLIIQASAEDI